MYQQLCLQRWIKLWMGCAHKQFRHNLLSKRWPTQTHVQQIARGTAPIWNRVGKQWPARVCKRFENNLATKLWATYVYKRFQGHVWLPRLWRHTLTPQPTQVSCRSRSRHKSCTLCLLMKLLYGVVLLTVACRLLIVLTDEVLRCMQGA